MGKLQLYITIAYKGYREMLDINADSTAKKSVCNLSGVVEKIKYKTGKINIFFMLRYIPEGVFLTVLRTIPALKPDHLAAWIFIPYDIKISTGEIEEVTDTVIRAISNSKITSETYAELLKLFEKEYDNIPLAGAIAPNSGTHTAYRFYGDITGYILSDLIGTKRYQTAYLPYSEVVLADKAVASAVNGHSLTDEPLEQMVKLFPPVSPDPAFRPTIFGCDFDKPFLAPLMGTVEIRWMHGDTAAAVQSVMVNRPNMKPDSVALEELLPAAPQDTHPTAEPERQPAQATQQPKQPIQQQPRQPAQQAPQPTQQSMQNQEAQPNKPQAAKRKPSTPYFSSQTRTYQNEQGDPLVQRPKSDIKSRISGFIGKLPNIGKSVASDPYAKMKALWAGIGFVLGVLVTMMCTCISNHGEKSDSKVFDLSSDSLEISSPVEIVDVPTETPQSDGSITIPKAPDTSIDGAITYLEGFKTWTKPELEKYPELAGLYDDMNNFNLQRLVSHWGPKLKKSKRFNKVVEHAQQAIKRGKKPRVPEGQKTFNTPNRQTIKIMTYLNTIDP